jgi:tetratricopeptide (TPR) repeat protein
MTTNADAAGRAARLLHGALLKEGEGDGPAAMADAREACSLFEQGGDRTGCAAALQLQAILHANHGHLGPALEALDAAVPHRSETGDFEGLASLHQERFALAIRQGDRDLARDSSEAMLAAFERVGDREGQAQGIHQLVQFLVQAGELDTADELLSRGLWLTDGAGEERARSALVLLQVQADIARGMHERALARCRDALRLAEQARNRPALVEAWHQLGAVYTVTGELEQAQQAFEQALDGRELLKDLEGRAATLTELARVEQALGHVEAACDRLAYAGRTLGELGLLEPQASALGEAAELAASGGHTERALRHGEELVTVCAAAGAVDAQGQALFLNGQRRIQTGDLEGAGRDFRSAAVALDEAQSPESRGIVLGMLGQVEHALGRVDEAQVTLTEAERVLIAVGSDALAELAPILAELREG